jgi:hypothetical protein
LTLEEYENLPKDHPLELKIGSCYRPTNEKAQRVYEIGNEVSYFEVISVTENRFESVLKFIVLE